MHTKQCLTPEKEARGFRAESRFFHIVNSISQSLPRGFVRVERSTPLMDVRGIDGYVHHYRGAHSTATRRIPIQLKTGYVQSDGHYYQTHRGLRVPIMPISLEMSAGTLMAGIRRLLDAFDRSPCTYEHALVEMELSPPSHGELEVVELIERSRMRYGSSHVHEDAEHRAHSLA